MKTVFVFLFLLIGVLSLDDQSYLTGFCNQLGFTQDQITANINCFSNANTDIQNFKDAVSTNGASISDSQILNFIQEMKLVLVDSCSSFQDNLVDYFSANTNAPVFQDALCNNIDTYNSQIKQKLVTWASTSQDSDAGKQHAYIYQVLFGVASLVPTASFTTSVSYRVVTFDAGASTAPEGSSITSYAWNFGESSSGSNTASGASSTATHTYASTGGSFTVTLTITDSDGDTATKTGSVTVAANSAPTASFTETISSKTITFDAGASTDSDGSIATYAWNFGESSSGSNTASGSTSSASHTYASYGAYTIVLTVTDNEGATATYSNSVTINSPPTASFTNSVSSYTVSFNAAGSTDSDGTISTYAWNFGESSSPSNTASGSTASHTYAAYGTYTVTLTVTDNDGATGTQTTNVAVSAPGITVSFSNSASYSGNQVTFTPSSTATIVTYAWDFGDSSSSSNTASVAKPYHVYAAAGTYTVSLTATDNTGATGTASKTITVTSSCGSLLHFIEGWSTNGDCDIVVRTPNGNVIAYWNGGPDSSTDQGTWLNDSTNGSAPEEICWATGKTPPSGTYNICLNINFNPSPSVTAQLNVIKGGVVSYYTKTFTSSTYSESCNTGDAAFVTSITYP